MKNYATSANFFPNPSQKLEQINSSNIITEAPEPLLPSPSAEKPPEAEPENLVEKSPVEENPPQSHQTQPVKSKLATKPNFNIPKIPINKVKDQEI